MGVHSVIQGRFSSTKLLMAKYSTKMMTVTADMSKPGRDEEGVQLERER